MSLTTVASGARPRIAYMMSRFPAVSETFILNEMLVLDELGLQIEIFPLIRQRVEVLHPGMQTLLARLRHRPFWSGAVLTAQAYWLRRNPRAYLRAWRDALLGNRSSRKFLLRALVIVPQAAAYARDMQALGIEHIHAHWATHPALSAYVIHQLTGIPYSITAHAHDLYVERPMLEQKIRAACFIALKTEYNRQLLRTWYGDWIDSKAVIVRPGIDLSLFAPPAERRRNAVVTLLHVATLRDYKGHRYMLDACALLKARGLHVRYVCVGEGVERPRLEAQIERLGLRDCVELLGAQPGDRVAQLMAAADIFVMPSITTPTGKKEGLPYVLIEALACELPVVATALSGIPELIRHEQTGLLVPEQDATALADAVQRLIREPELARRLARAGRELVLRDFDVRRNTALLRDLVLHDWRHQPQDGRVPLPRQAFQAEVHHG